MIVAFRSANEGSFDNRFLAVYARYSRQQIGNSDSTGFGPIKHDGNEVVLLINVTASATSFFALTEEKSANFNTSALEIDDPVDRERSHSMFQTLVEHYRRCFEYEKDSHRKVLAALETVPPERRGSEPFQKAMNLMGHIIAARRMWLFRFGAGPTRPAGLFPSGLTRSQLLADVGLMERDWSGYLKRLDESEASRVFEYQSIDGGRYRNTVVDILTQLHGHSLYHRGQIASLIRAAGGEPVETDFVFWSREPVETPG